ncbi:hypothetical protein ACFVRB_27755 [Streptomyces nojiriensis]|uniref:hypothetical protein n=1 Tax=Streptomyces nojiriensis TaxID=66374 RepID=UPI0036DE1309
MPHERALDLVQITDPHDVTPELRQELVDCWIAVTNAGGAAGFPFPPVGDHDVTPVADKVVGQLNPQQSRLLVAKAGGVLGRFLPIIRSLVDVCR